MYKLEIDVPGLPEGAGVQIAGLGTFENGDTVIVTDKEHDAFRRYHGQVVSVTNDDGEIVGSKLELGATLIQSNFLNGITASTHKETAAEKKAREAEEAKAQAESENTAPFVDEDNQEGDES